MLRRDRIAAFLFIAPAAALILAFVIWPIVYAGLGSVHDLPFTSPTLDRYIGAANYEHLIDDPSFRRSVRNTIVFTALVVPLQTIFALLLALWTNGRGPVRRGLRIAAFIPTTMSLTVLSVVWTLLYQRASPTGSGLINGLLMEAGLPARPFLSSADQALPAIVFMSIWQGVGLQMMIFLAALQAVPERLYEAATLDGAGRLRRFLNVTLPSIAPTIAFVALITTLFALKLFAQPYIMTKGGPEGSTISVVQYMYEAAFIEYDLGLACAAGVLFFIAVSGIAGLLRWLQSRAEALTG
jgi:multiple sugar transport system permease protein